MRVDTDTYVWGVKRILIERKDDGENARTNIRFIGGDGEEVATATLCVWGEGRLGSYTLPEVAVAEPGAEARVIVEAATP
jgi:hypothetical protein